MKRTLLCTLALLAITGCTTESRSPDAIREDTARATQEAARDAKAVVQGVAEGLHAKGPININRANVDQLQSLPGIDAVGAQKIIAARPYNNAAELYRRRVISKSQYEHIADRVVAK